MLYLPLKNIVIGYTEIGYIRTIIKEMLNLGSKILFFIQKFAICDGRKDLYENVLVN